MKETFLTSIRAFPFVKAFRDYHDIKIELELLQTYFGNSIRALELEFYNGYYQGLFFIDGQKPTPEEISNEIRWYPA